MLSESICTLMTKYHGVSLKYGKACYFNNQSYTLNKRYKLFCPDEKLKQLALVYRPNHHKIIEGRILTGDQFLVGINSKKYHQLREELEGDVVDMEGAAVAHVCTIIPFDISCFTMVDL
jgi:nucleoside phosphorylase